jgi:hypothetical protein
MYHLERGVTCAGSGGEIGKGGEYEAVGRWVESRTPYGCPKNGIIAHSTRLLVAVVSVVV